jgi:hypothetical protein
VKIRFVCASAAAAFGFACSSSAFSRVVVAYAPAAVVVAEPRPVYYYGPPVPKPLPVYTAPTNYGPMPAANVMYAQPVVVVPR